LPLFNVLGQVAGGAPKRAGLVLVYFVISCGQPRGRDELKQMGDNAQSAVWQKLKSKGLV